jgi:hypothetical protein
MIAANRILKTGEQRNGKILEVWDTNVTINNNPQVGLLVEVKDKYGKNISDKNKNGYFPITSWRCASRTSSNGSCGPTK